jgi:hypothetical protein
MFLTCTVRCQVGISALAGTGPSTNVQSQVAVLWPLRSVSIVPAAGKKA